MGKWNTMRILMVVVAAFILIALVGLAFKHNDILGYAKTPLPVPIYKSNVSVEEALLKRRSIQAYKDVPISLQELSQMLWAAQGVTTNNGGKTATSASALYPLEI